MSVAADVESLARLAVFADLPQPKLQALVHTYGEEVFAAGQRVLRRGLSGSNLYVILDGDALVLVDGRELARLGRGDFFGEVSALLGEPPSADVVAQTPLRCLVIPEPNVRAFLLENPSVAVRMLEA